MKKQGKFMKTVSYVLGGIIVLAMASAGIAVIIMSIRYIAG